MADYYFGMDEYNMSGGLSRNAKIGIGALLVGLVLLIIFGVVIASSSETKAVPMYNQESNINGNLEELKKKAAEARAEANKLAAADEANGVSTNQNSVNMAAQEAARAAQDAANRAQAAQEAANRAEQEAANRAAQEAQEAANKAAQEAKEAANKAAANKSAANKAAAEKAEQEAKRLQIEADMARAAAIILAPTCVPPPIGDQYMLYQGKDSSGNDIKKSTERGRIEFAIECLRDNNCKGFNTNGYLKRSIKPYDQLNKVSSFDKRCEGIFVKKPNASMRPNAPYKFWADKFVAPPSRGKYLFYQGKDSSGGDMVRASNASNKIPELSMACLLNPMCKGFNSNAWLKQSVKSPSRFSTVSSFTLPHQGVYIKK